MEKRDPSSNPPPVSPLPEERIFLLRKMLKSKYVDQRLKALQEINALSEVPHAIMSDIKNLLWQDTIQDSEIVERMMVLFRTHDEKGYQTFCLLKNKAMSSPKKERRDPREISFGDGQEIGEMDPTLELVEEIGDDGDDDPE